MSDPSHTADPIGPLKGGHRWDASRQVCRWVLATVIVAGTAVVLWRTPTEVQPDNLSLDLQAGKVSVVQVGCLSEKLIDGPGLIGFPLLDGPSFQRWSSGSQAQDSRQVCWTNKSGRSYVAEFASVADEWRALLYRAARRLASDHFFEQSIASTVQVASPGDDDPAAYVPSPESMPTVLHDRWRSWSRAAVQLSVLGLLTTMLGGRQPRRGTRWGVFWVMLAGSGLGTVWYLVREAPWSRSAGVLPEPVAGAREILLADGTRVSRFGGGTGFLVALLTTLLAAVVLNGLAEVTIGRDHAGDSAVFWSLVGRGGDAPLVYTPYA